MFVENKNHIRERITVHREAIQSLGVQRVGLFGSFARGEQNAGSDVDLIVHFRPGQKSFDHFMQLSFLLEEILGRKVDLITSESLSPHLGPRILSEVEYGLVD